MHYYWLQVYYNICISDFCLCDVAMIYLQMHTILDEIIFGGQVLETSSTEVMRAIEEISKCSLSPSLSLSLRNLAI